MLIGVVLSLAAPALGGNAPCATCQRLAGGMTADPVGAQIQELMRPIQFDAPKSNPTVASAQVNWDGGDKLPNAFEAPWQLPYRSDFDPTFRTPYWTDDGGFTDSPWAPWNLFLPPTMAKGAYSLGMLQIGMPTVSGGWSGTGTVNGSSNLTAYLGRSASRAM